MKRLLPKLIYLLLAFLVISVQIPLDVSKAAAGDIVQVSKTVNPTQIFEGEETEVTLNVTGSNPVNFVKPNDIILVIDRSGSMAKNYAPNNGEDKMGNAKSAAKGFIDLVDFSKHRVGIVDFASNTGSKNLTTDVASLKQYVDGIQASGGTNTQAAIDKARQLLVNHRPDAQPVILLMTDGQATEPSPEANARQLALAQANAAKNEKVVFYTIALLLPNENPATSGPNILMKEMATTAQHHHFVLGSVGLAEIYAAIVDEIGLASAYDAVVTDNVSADFEIVPGSYKDNIPQPTVTGNTLVWKFNELKAETLTLKYKIRHKVGHSVGDQPVGSSPLNVTYKDYLNAPHEFDTEQPKVNIQYPAPVITSITENKGLVDGGYTVVIEGKNFKAKDITFGGISSPLLVVENSTKITATVPAGSQGTVPVRLTNIDGKYAEINFTYYANPVIESVVPNFGPLAGGNDVTINGKYFLEGAAVSFADNLQAAVKSFKPNQLVVAAPAGAAIGTVPIKVTNPDGTFVKMDNAYTYKPSPRITALNPNKGSTTGGTLVTISGNSFENGAKVFFGTKELQSTVISDTEIKITAPSWATSGPVDVKVVNPDQQSDTLKQGYIYELPAPVVTTISPNSGLQAGGDIIRITGQNFVNGAKVLLDQTEISATFIDSTQLRIRVPAWPTAESVDVQVVNPDNQFSVVSDGYTYNLPPNPTITGITPTEGPLKGGTIVTIQGTNFALGSKVFFNETELTTTYVSSESLKVTTPKWSTAEQVDVKVLSPNGQNAKLEKAFNYLAPPPPPAPTVTSITPNQGPQAGGTIIVINGTNFQGGVKVYLKDTEHAVTYVGEGQLKVRTLPWTTGETVDIKIVNPDNQSFTVNQAFTFISPPPPPGPKLTSLSPNNGFMEGGNIIVIKGENFVNGAKILFDQVEVGSTFVSGNELKVKVPKWTVDESVDIKIVNPDGQNDTLVDAYTFNPPPPPPKPEVTSISPNTGLITGGSVVTITGNNYQQGAKVQWGNTEIAATFIDAARLKVRVPAVSTAGSITVTVINPDGQKGELANGYTYTAPPAPVIQMISPNTGYVEGNVILNIAGQNFTSGAKVYFNTTELTATFISDTQLRIKTPVWTGTGSVDVKVQNPDGQFAVQAGGFTYIPPAPKPSPVIKSVTPNSGPTAGGNVIIIYGTNFVSGVKVQVGTTELAATFVDSTQLKVKLLAGNAGVVSIKVTNPDGQQAELADAYTYIAPPPPPAPVVSNVSPNNGPIAGGAVILINGSNFVSGAKVQFGTNLIAATFVSANQLKIRVPAAAGAGSIDVKVINPDGSSGQLASGYTYN